MNQNFWPFSVDIKVAFGDGEQAAIGLGACTPLELVKKLMFLTFLYIYQ